MSWFANLDKMDIGNLPPSVSGAHAAQAMGKRANMEDRYCFAAAGAAGLFAAVYDGHGGAGVSSHLAERMPAVFMECIAGGGSADRAFERTFERLDAETGQTDEGSTAVCAWITAMEIVTANCGDARALMIAADGRTVETLSRLHLVSDMEERARILATGARVTDPYYSLGGDKWIMPTRSFGDMSMRSAGLISKPHLARRPLPQLGGYAFLSSDGLFDVLTDDDIGRVFKSRPPAELAVNELIRLGAAASDNTTALVVALNAR